jgi:predicted PurR-regulated permease PerM
VERRVIKIDITPRSILYGILAVAAAWVLWQLAFVVVLIVVSLVLAGTIQPFVAWLERRRVPRSVALVLTFFLLVGAIAAVALVTLPPLVAQLLDIIEKAPKYQAKLAATLSAEAYLRPLALTVRDARAAQLLGFVSQHILDLGTRIVVFAGEALTTVFLALYFVSGREREQAALFAIVPRRAHMALARILKNLGTIVGGYVRGQLLTSGLIGLFAFIVLTAFSVPNALALAVLAALTDVIPFVGGLLATAPAVLATLGARGWAPAIIVLALLVVYQEIESRILVPRVYGRVLRLSPVLVIVSLLVGGTLLGIVGALLALPVAAGIRMIIRELRVEMPGDDADHTDDRMRDAAAQRAFEDATAGAPPTKAAEVASQIVEAMTDEEPPHV